MRLDRDGDSMVSTPVYAGSDEDVRKAARCAHFFEARGEPEAIPGGKVLLHLECCKFCVGTRVRATPAGGVTHEEFLKTFSNAP